MKIEEKVEQAYSKVFLATYSEGDVVATPKAEDFDISKGDNLNFILP